MKRVMGPGRFGGLEERMQRWLGYEQTANERLMNLQVYRPIETRLAPHLRPEAQPVWDQEVVWLPGKLARCYGDVDAELQAALGIVAPEGRSPLFLHPQPIAAHRRLARAHGCERLAAIAATPTSSYRSVLVWRKSRTGTPAVLKLSLGAIVGTVRRAFREEQIARAVMISKVFEEISRENRERHHLDWFRETAGVAETHSGHGWLLRRLPECLQQSRTTAVPVCSLISRRGKRSPLLVELIGRSRLSADAFVVDRVLRPYVKALAFLLFEEGLPFEGHSQNVLFEIDESEGLTGRVLLRDLSDSFVSIPMRIARGKSLPVSAKGTWPRRPPFSVVMNAYGNRWDPPVLSRGYKTVEHYGLWAFVWAINTSMARYFKGYSAQRVVTRYLELWQEAAIEHLRLRPLFREEPRGLATDEALAWFLTHIDWRALGAAPAALHRDAVPLRIDRRVGRRSGRVYERLECPWGDLFIWEGLPAWFRPAF